MDQIENIDIDRMVTWIEIRIDELSDNAKRLWQDEENEKHCASKINGFEEVLKYIQNNRKDEISYLDNY